MARPDKLPPTRSSPPRTSAPTLDPRGRESLEDTDRRIWDLVYHLIHPAALYVLFQLLIISHLGDAPPLRSLHPAEPVSLAIYLAQFLGAWAVFYTTLLRDMGYRSAAGTILLLVALAGMITQYFLFPEPRQADPEHVTLFLGIQLGLAVVCWPTVFVPWRREKAKELARQEAAESEATPR